MQLISLVKAIFLLFRFGLINEITNKHALLRWLGYLNIFYYLNLDRGLGNKLTNYLESMGPLFIKLGQLLSTRTDLLDKSVINELKRLTDSCPPFEASLAISAIEESMAASIDEIFQKFNPIPIAAASLAQVHEAELVDGTKIAIKVLRPNIHKSVRSNIKLMKFIGAMASLIIKDSQRLRIRQVLNDYEDTVMNELDLKIEASNAIRTKKFFENESLLKVPTIFKQLSSRNILVMEKVEGIPCTDLKEIQATGIDLKRLAENGVKIFLDQVFRDNFFHADMHPGNIFVNRDSKVNGYVAVDYAICGSLNDQDRYFLARMLVALIEKNFKNLAKLFVQANWVRADTDIFQLELTLTSACSDIIDKPLSKIEFGKLLVELFDATRKFDLTIQPSLVLLQKTLIHIEGMGRQIYPELDFWGIAKPYLDLWLLDQYNPVSLLKQIANNRLEILEHSKNLPANILNLIENFDINLQTKKALEKELLKTNLKLERLERIGKLIAVISLTLALAITFV
ncbi:MAG: AarF/UbiB family protein [Gammaproteobacteria bacterium]